MINIDRVFYVIIFYNENQYQSVLIRYLESLKKNLKSIPTEYQKMYADLVRTK